MHTSYSAQIFAIRNKIDDLRGLIMKYDRAMPQFSLENQAIVRQYLEQAESSVAAEELRLDNLERREAICADFEKNLPHEHVLTRWDGTTVMTNGRHVLGLTRTLRPIVVTRVEGFAVLYVATIKEDVILAEIYVGDNLTKDKQNKIMEVVSQFSDVR